MMNTNVPFPDTGRDVVARAIGGQWQMPADKYREFACQFLRLPAQQEEALTTIAKVLLGKMNSVEEFDKDSWEGEVWEASIDLDPQSGNFTLVVDLTYNWNDRWRKSPSDRIWSVWVECLKAEWQPETGLMLQFEFGTSDFRPGRPQLPEPYAGAPIRFAPGEHLTSGAVFKVISRIYEIYALASDEVDSPDD